MKGVSATRLPPSLQERISRLIAQDETELAAAELQKDVECDDDLLFRVFRFLASGQTTEELREMATIDRNNRGFDSVDAPNGTRLYKLLSFRQDVIDGADKEKMRGMVVKYRSQIITRLFATDEGFVRQVLGTPTDATQQKRGQKSKSATSSASPASDRATDGESGVTTPVSINTDNFIVDDDTIDDNDNTSSSHQRSSDRSKALVKLHQSLISAACCRRRRPFCISEDDDDDDDDDDNDDNDDNEQEGQKVPQNDKKPNNDKGNGKERGKKNTEKIADMNHRRLRPRAAAADGAATREKTCRRRINAKRPRIDDEKAKFVRKKKADDDEVDDTVIGSSFVPTQSCAMPVFSMAAFIALEGVIAMERRRAPAARDLHRMHVAFTAQVPSTTYFAFASKLFERVASAAGGVLRREDLHAGERVLVLWPSEETWHECTVQGRDASGKIRVRYKEDGSTGTLSSDEDVGWVLKVDDIFAAQ